MSNWEYVETNIQYTDGFPFFHVFAKNVAYGAIAEILCSGSEESPGTLEEVCRIYVDPDDPRGYLTADAFLLRDLPLKSLLAQARMDIDSVPTLVGGKNVPAFMELAKEWPKGDVDEVARWAGHIYLSAIRNGNPANKAVQDAYGMSRSTASRVIRRARMLGYIPADIVAPPAPGRGTSNLKVVK